MNYFEECLTFGDQLLQDERRALYKFLLESNSDFYTLQAINLLNSGKISRTIANGEIIYFVKNNFVTYSARKLHSNDYSENVRQMRLSRFKFLNLKMLRKFFAQGDVDVIRNFPIPGKEIQEDNGFGTSVYPYYSLAYYANGKNYLLGLVKKLRTNDKEILTKLRTL